LWTELIVDQALIDRIVASVLEQLQPVTPRAVTDAAPTPTPKSTVVALPDAVITADVLSAVIKPGQSVQIGIKSLLTPSAKDWLKQHRIDWHRRAMAPKSASTTPPPLRCQLLLSTVTATVRGAADSVFRALPNWSRSMGGSAKEVVETATRSITTAECNRIVITSRDADLIACSVNRNQAVRAAVAMSAEHVRRLDASLSPNVIVVDPTERSFVELRNLFRSCAQLTRPTAKAL
jgi:hypothetical protein